MSELSKIDLSKIRHDFVNNGIRLEVLNKLITDKLEANQPQDTEHLTDLKTFLQLHLKLLEKLKDTL